MVSTYCSNSGKDLIAEFLDELPNKEAAYGLTILQELDENGIKALKSFNTRQLYKKLYEVKFYNNRFMYVVENENSIYIIHACKKQKNRTEINDRNVAIERAKELGKELGIKFV